MRNKRIIGVVRKLLSEGKEMSTDGIHQHMLGKNYCPSKSHLGTILASLPFVTVCGSFTNEHGSERVLWRMKDET